jgi:hypothetical protein
VRWDSSDESHLMSIVSEGFELTWHKSNKKFAYGNRVSIEYLTLCFLKYNFDLDGSSSVGMIHLKF